jgi:hypothetical protein
MGLPRGTCATRSRSGACSLFVCVDVWLWTTIQQRIFFLLLLTWTVWTSPKCNQLSYIKMLRINLGNLIDPFPCLLLWRRSPSTAPLTYGTSSAKHPGHDQGVTERLGEPGIGAHDC